MEEKLKSKNHYLSKHVYKEVLQNYKYIIPDLNLHMLKNRIHRRYVKHPMYKKFDTIPQPPVCLHDINKEENPTKKITQLYYLKIHELKLQNDGARCVKNSVFEEIKNDVIEKRTYLIISILHTTRKHESSITHGPKSPLDAMEKDLVELVILLGATGCPLTPPQVILLVIFVFAAQTST
jgi:hypothetical protein